MFRQPPQRGRNPLSLALSLLLIVQGVMPSGYMPASVAEGWPVALCPEGLPPAFLLVRPAAAPRAGHHANHHDHGGAEQSGQEVHAGASDYCPIGSALDVSAVAVLVATGAAGLRPYAHPTSSYQRPALTVEPAAFRSRAPPAVA